uniref:ADP-ribosylation factor GTPase-activating protein AGD3-like n=1 Tax=Tanacetum cinerariifolium TaxID=118510 RepID=A0A699HEG6_TANCI|nr:ADP-ribosylation factor GTPase-activating protein AGD3-like [Tanacetum cinerariifolium]
MIQQGVHSMVLTEYKKNPSPDMIKFEHVLKELRTYNENIGTQEARKRFDKADAAYSHVRDKYLSLRKSTQTKIASATEEYIDVLGTLSARMHFEQARFSLVCALSNVEAKKRFKFLESVG